MSRKVCRRRHYPLINPIQMAIEGASVTPDDLLDQLRLVELSALESFRTGRAEVSDWCALADVVNVAETMARAGIGLEVLDACVLASAGLTDARERHLQAKHLGLSGPAMQALRDLVEYHDLQRRSVSRGEYERCIALTANRIRSAHPSTKMTVKEDAHATHE